MIPKIVNRPFATLAFLIMAWYAYGTGLAAWQFVTTDASVFDPLFRYKYEANLGLVIVHGATAIATLLLGPWLFVIPAQGRTRTLHRVLGRLYALLVVVAGVTGLRMSLMAYGGLISTLGLGTQGVLWIATLGFAISSARLGRIGEHRRWMIRNYALTFGAVLLRSGIALGDRFGFDYQLLYPVLSWTGWVACLLGAEVIIRLPELRAWAKGCIAGFTLQKSLSPRRAVLHD